ncbi:ELL-associated factor 1-like [Ostrea edulis]|uniref:ELL-associated factor 1-like n=1 Tax=Ostrea edulis TaxID=37623 RepID=UPI0024AF9136|nr:ELL-associated factor 1-like [Ostrea edulis]
MTEKILPVDNKVHELKLGSSFEPRSRVAFHSFRYDFMPASVDATQQGLVDVGEGHQITVSLPHVEGSGTSHTMYKGNKRPSPKECVLIIDHQTGTFTLERLSNTVNLKKTRMEGSSKITQNSRPLTPVDVNKRSPVKQKAVTTAPNNVSPPTPPMESPTVTPVHDEPKNEDSQKSEQSCIGFISSSDESSSDSDNSASDSEDEFKTSNGKPGQGLFGSQSQSLFQTAPSSNILGKDLELSDSDSD